MPLGANDFDAIEIAVRTTGQSAVADLQAELARTKNEINNLAAALQAGIIPATEFTARATDMIAKQKDLEQAVKSATRVINGQSAALASTQGQAYGAQRAILELSRGFEDLSTGGFLGVLNNIPGTFGGIAQAAGLAAPQVALVEGAAAALGTTAYLVYTHWRELKKLFDDGINQRLITDLKDVQAELKKLEAIEVKTRINYADIDVAKRKIAELTEAEKIYQALKSGKTVDQSERGKLVSQAITEQGGGIDAVIKAAADSTPTPESEATRKAREAVAFIQNPANRNRAGTDAANLRKYEGLLADAKDQDRRDHFEATKGIVTGAAGGNERQRQYLEDLVKANGGRFATAGVGPDFLKALQGSSQAVIERKNAAEAQNKIDEDQREQEKKLQQEKDKAAREAKQVEDARLRDIDQRTNEGARKVGPGVDDALQKALFDAIKGGSTPEAAQKAQRGGVIGTLRGRGIGEDVVGDVANKILEKAADSALNLINEGGQPRLDVKAAAAKAKADRDAEALRTKAAADRKKQVDAIDQAFVGTAATLLAANDLKINQGAPIARSPRQEQQLAAQNRPYALPPEVLARRIDARIGRDLARTGNDPNLAPEIRARADDLYRRKATEAQARTPLPDPTAAIAGFGAQQGRAMADQAQATAALIQVIGGLQAQAARTDIQTLRNLGMVRGLQQNQRRGVQQRKTLLPN